MVVQTPCWLHLIRCSDVHSCRDTNSMVYVILFERSNATDVGFGSINCGGLWCLRWQVIPCWYCSWKTTVFKCIYVSLVWWETQGVCTWASKFQLEVLVQGGMTKAIYVWFFAPAKLNSRHGRHIWKIQDGRHSNQGHALTCRLMDMKTHVIPLFYGFRICRIDLWCFEVDLGII